MSAVSRSSDTRFVSSRSSVEVCLPYVASKAVTLTRKSVRNRPGRSPSLALDLVA